MPTSPLELIVPVVAAVKDCARKHGGVQSVLDLGCGDGFYGVAVRRYLEHVHNRFGPDEWEVKLVGVEGYEGFETISWGYYDTVHRQLIQDYLREHNERFDVILLLDVLEHFEFAQALEVLRQAYERTDKYLLVSSPSGFREQWEPEKAWDTELQKHRCGLSPATTVEKVSPRFRVEEVRRDHWFAVIFNEYLAAK